MENNPYIAIFLLLFPLGLSASERISLSDYLAKVRENDLELKTEVSKAEAADARSSGIALPPPMVAFARMRDDAGTSRGYEINQMIPFPTKLTNDHSGRKEESRAQKEMNLAKEREILAQAKRAYFSLWVAQEKIEILKEKKDIIEGHIKLSRSGVRSDSFLKIHLLKSESDLDLLENEIEEANQALRESKVRAAELVNADAASFDVTASEPPESKVSSSTEKTGLSHQVESKRHTLESFKSFESVANSSWLPDFTLRYKQMGPGSMFGQYNEAMVGVTLPFVFFWEPNAASKDASQKRVQAELELEQAERRIENERYSLTRKAMSLKSQLENINTKLLPRAKTRMNLVHNIVPRDMESLQDHRETMEAFPDLKLKALDLRLEFETAVSELEKYTSSEAAHE
ncbi:MAG: TolC family protein [Bdellovibrionales bacterium]|nr:TolC family protein [Bdellovibrionales bacterium]